MNLGLKDPCDGSCQPLRWPFHSGACSKQPDIKSTASELEKAFPAAAAPAPTQAQPAAPISAAQADANTLVNQALAAAKANDYAGGVIALLGASGKRGLTPEQILAIQDAKNALVGELQRRAAGGDQAAVAQLKAIEKTRSQ